MTEDFFTCLSEERSIFRNFNSYSDLGDFQVFHSPGSDEIPHWNLAYPINLQKLIPNSQDLAKLKSYFKGKNLSGHLAVIDQRFASKFSEESEYFAINSSPIIEPDSKVNLMTHVESELDQFCDLIQISFSLEDRTVSYFRKKMAMLQNRPGTKFYIMKLNAQIVGGCSVFTTDNCSSFMFNVATHPSMQGGGIAKEIIAYAAKMSIRPLYTYSHNPIMRESILPNLGFSAIGTLWCVPLHAV